MKTTYQGKISDQHREKGKRFCYLLQSGEIQISKLPNHALDFGHEQRVHDKERYVKYITSSCYEDVSTKEVSLYVGD